MNKWDVTFGVLLALLMVFLVFKIELDNTKNQDACVEFGGNWCKVYTINGQFNLKCEFNKSMKRTVKLVD